MTPIVLVALLASLVAPVLAARTDGEAKTLIRVAVAANFAVPFAEIARAYQRETGYRVEAIPGSTGKLYAQVVNGAPFDVFLSADDVHARKLERAGQGVHGTVTPYATGHLVLWSRDPNRLAGDPIAALRSPKVRKLAIANPELAPYGRAALETLDRLGLEHELANRLVVGESIAQALQFAESGGADAAFIARSQALDPKLRHRGSRWDVPDTLHAPIVQSGVLLVRGTGTPGAPALLEYLHGRAATRILERWGYSAPVILQDSPLDLRRGPR